MVMYKFDMTEKDMNILATLFNCTKEDIEKEIAPIYDVNRSKYKELMDIWSNLQINIEPPSYDENVDEDYDKCLTFGIFYESDETVNPVTIESILSGYGTVCSEDAHFDKNFFEQFKESLQSLYESENEGTYVIKIENNTEGTDYQISSDDFKTMIDSLDKNDDIETNIKEFMNILKEKGDVIRHHAHEYDSSTYTLLFNAKNDKDEIEYDK